MIEIIGLRDDFGQRRAGGRRVDQLGAFHQGGRLGQPCRKPEGFDLPLGLVARAGAAVETVERGSLKEKRPKHGITLKVGT